MIKCNHPQTLRIEVTERDICKGLPNAKSGGPFVSPIARHKISDFIVVHYDRVDTGLWPFTTHWAMPEDVQVWLKNFDDGKPMKPITFDLVSIDCWHHRWLREVNVWRGRKY